MKRRRGGCRVKWLEVKLTAQINRKRWVEMSEWMDGKIHTAVEGVDPGEPGQAMSTEGLHPPILSLCQSLCFSLMSSALFFWCFSCCRCFLFLSLIKQPSSHRKKKKEAFGVEKMSKNKKSQSPTGWQASELNECMRCVCLRVREQTTGWRRTPPTVARGREKHSLSLWLALSLASTPPLPLFWFCANASSAFHSLPLSGGRNIEPVHRNWTQTRFHAVTPLAEHQIQNC